jgi:hypothetical protein
MPQFTYTARPPETLFAESDYQFYVENCIERQHDGDTEESQYDMFILTLRLWLPAQNKWSSRLRDYLRFPPSPGAWRIGTFLKSIGRKVSERENVNLEANEFIEAQGWLTITHREYEGAVHNNVKYIRRSLKPTETPQGPPKPATANARKTPPQQKPAAQSQAEADEPNWDVDGPGDLPEGPTQPAYDEDDYIDMGGQK